MKLLLLIPNLVLLGISGFNLYTGFTTPQGPNYIVYTLLHVMVSIICLTFIGVIIRSMFTVKYVNAPENIITEEQARFKGIHFQRQAVNA